MSNTKHSCPINSCNWCATPHHFVKHLTSTHFDELKKKHDTIAIKVAVRDKRCATMTMDHKPHWICYGCNKFWARKSMADNHMKTCENKTKHCDFLKSLHAEPEEEIVADSSSNEAILKLQAEIAQLRKEVKDLKAENKSLQMDIDDNKEKCNAWDVLSEVLYRDETIDLASIKENCIEFQKERYPDMDDIDWRILC